MWEVVVKNMLSCWQRCHTAMFLIRTYHHQVARNMMMFYLLAGDNDVTCSHL